MMVQDHLVDMANRIGEFFEAWPDRGEALEGVATHLRKYWEPRMRRQLLVLLDGASGESLSPLVREALQRYRAMLTPVS